MIAATRVRWAAGVMGGVLVLALLTVAVLIGVWLRFGPVNYFGCGVTRPEHITAADLVGTYVAAGGAHLQLLSDGTWQAQDLSPDDEFDSRPPPSGSGSWQLIEAEHGMAAVSLADDSGYAAQPFDIAGTRERPQLYRLVGDPDSCDLYTFTQVEPSS